jgi:hypothetical protein
MGYYNESLPPRVRTALEVLEHCRVRENGDCCSLNKSELSKPETALQRQAWQVLTLYLAGEMDFGDQPPKRIEPPEDGGAGSAVPVNV